MTPLQDAAEGQKKGQEAQASSRLVSMSSEVSASQGARTLSRSHNWREKKRLRERHEEDERRWQQELQLQLRVDQHQADVEEEEDLSEQPTAPKSATPCTAKDSHAKDSPPSASISKANGKASTSPKKISMPAKEGSKLRGSHQPQSDDSDDEDLRTTKSKVEDNEWCTEGNEYIGNGVRLYVFDSTGKPTDAADGTIAGWLSKEKSNLFAANTPPERDRPHPPRKPAALWRLK